MYLHKTQNNRDIELKSIPDVVHKLQLRMEFNLVHISTFAEFNSLDPMFLEFLSSFIEIQIVKSPLKNPLYETNYVICEIL